MAAKEQATYSHGHHQSVVQAHARRTAQDSLAFLLPSISKSDHVLDVGCGPGSITLDVARLVPEGRIVGCDAVEAVVKQAEELAQAQGVKNATFDTLDGNSLPFKDNTFDVVFCHQVLQHVKNPVGILREMCRVVKPGGVVAAREADYRTFAWYPESAILDRWGQLYEETARFNGGQPNAGRYMLAWAKQAGFPPESIQYTWTTWHYDGELASNFAESWKGRALYSGYGKTAREQGFAEEEELKSISQGWSDWGRNPDAFIRIPNGEILCRKMA